VLEYSESVQTIELQLGHLLADPIMDHINDANGVLDFLRSSSTLRTVKLRTRSGAKRAGMQLQ
jgi:hypothetical protein